MSEGRIRVLFVGRWETRKGFPRALAVARTLLEEFQDSEFHFVGEQTDELESGVALADFRAWQQSSDAGTRAQLHGRKSLAELHESYANADVLFFPSRFESFGLVALEGMRAGLAVVVSQDAGIAEFLQDGEDAILYDPRLGDADVDALRTLLLDERRRLNLGASARKLAEETLSDAYMAATISSHFQDLVTTHTGGVSCG